MGAYAKAGPSVIAGVRPARASAAAGGAYLVDVIRREAHASAFPTSTTTPSSPS